MEPELLSNNPASSIKLKATKSIENMGFIGVTRRDGSNGYIKVFHGHERHPMVW